ncbi:MAG: hypothetical protein WAN49_19970 [Pseudolabrys sp.]
MPRYYFHLTDGKQLLNNHKGIDLPGNAAAREDALALARDLEHEVVMPGWNWTGWFVTIVDQLFTKNRCREFSVDFLRPLAQSLFSARVPIAPASASFLVFNAV